MTLSIYQQLYWLTRLSDIDNILVTLIAFSVIAIIATYVIYIWGHYIDECWDKEELKVIGKKYRRALYIAWPLFALFTITEMLLPTKKDILFIVAGGKTIEFVQKDTSITKIPGQSTRLVTESLDLLEKKLKASVDK